MSNSVFSLRLSQLLFLLLYSTGYGNTQFTSLTKLLGENKMYFEQLSLCPGAAGGDMFNVSDIKWIRLSNQLVGLKGKVVFNRDVPLDTRASVSVKGLKNGKWVDQGMQTPPTNACDFIKSDEYFYPLLQTNSNLPKRCPFKKGEYLIQAGLDRQKTIIKILPTGCWQFTSILDQKGKSLACFSLFVKIAGASEGPFPKCTK